MLTAAIRVDLVILPGSMDQSTGGMNLIMMCSWVFIESWHFLTFWSCHATKPSLHFKKEWGDRAPAGTLFSLYGTHIDLHVSKPPLRDPVTSLCSKGWHLVFIVIAWGNTWKHAVLATQIRHPSSLVFLGLWSQLRCSLHSVFKKNCQIAGQGTPSVWKIMWSRSKQHHTWWR